MMPGMPPMAGMGQMGMGQPPMQGPPPQVMQSMDMLTQQPSPQGEDEALGQASAQIGLALSRIYLRSSRAATKLSQALKDIQEARTILQEEAQSAVMSPPDLMGAMASSPQGPPAGMMG